MPHSLSDEERLARIRLARSENIGPRTYFQLLQLFGSGLKAITQVPDMSLRGGRKKPITLSPHASALQEYERVKESGGEILIYGEDCYPQRLRHIPDPPPVLTILGKRELLYQDSVALVGARNASANGCRMAERLARELGKEGYITASGLARGIDTAVHHASLNTGTIAVIAGGVDHIYPKENTALYHAIKEHGVIVSEAPLGSTPRAEHFPRRNRIISGLSLGTIVVEATERSGSLITARLAGEQGRDVMAVPGSPMDPRASGPNRLIKQGATLIQSIEDVLTAISQHTQSYHPQQGLFEHDSLFDDTAPENTTTEIQSTPPQPDEREAVISLLNTQPLPLDELIRTSGMAVSAIQAILLELELAGRVERLPGNKIALLEMA